MMGHSFFPSWKVCKPSLKASPAIVPLGALVCGEHDPYLVFGHPIRVDVHAPNLEQELRHIPEEGVRDVSSPDKEYFP